MLRVFSLSFYVMEPSNGQTLKQCILTSCVFETYSAWQLELLLRKQMVFQVCNLLANISALSQHQKSLSCFSEKTNNRSRRQRTFPAPVYPQETASQPKTQSVILT